MNLEAARRQLRRDAVIRKLIECERSMAALRRPSDGKLRRLLWKIFRQKRQEAAYHKLGQEVRLLRDELLAIEQEHLNK